MSEQTDWIKKHPKAVTKQDLIHHELMISSSHAPVETNIKGIKELVIFDAHDTSLSYTVLVTAQDLNRMIEAYEAKKPFTFKEVAGSEYPEVVTVEYP